MKAYFICKYCTRFVPVIKSDYHYKIGCETDRYTRESIFNSKGRIDLNGEHIVLARFLL